MKKLVILVDEKDKEIGFEEKLEAHKKGLLHRAISVFIFNSKNELLLQKRAFDKYHCGGLWSNSCCTHPHPQETNLEAAKRRLVEEMGIKTELKEICNFTYKVHFPQNNLFEHEFDHLFIGHYDKDPKINLSEVADFKWISIETLLKEFQENPGNYTPWFKIIFAEVLKKSFK
ncbi:TPA: isopentenyl-diphosphate delta-isomerase [Candidatus Dependentiae bacterium]|nr:MAG: Isopentenyl-diphosphate Delta-isomerase [candidate division TM6 bacterium GW2011_GWE2_31_21]KKP53817.1 MAG: Isopentenyl-diphosphate Delta-isomerase [candidate division TM6 bacterium GW2011_GWF2_33_332]HBS47597.1 isopentenyl-diphosphate delta-isomerase [Candidatus Dependentiae bacterium]HBZ73746.1 isopentenyl-diphosphate delta-isomerase [Candidatus Dependentiae bacterium]